MGTKLYVGGLPYSVTEGRLQEIFSAHGAVESANVIPDMMVSILTGQSSVSSATSDASAKIAQILNSGS